VTTLAARRQRRSLGPGPDRTLGVVAGAVGFVALVGIAFEGLRPWAIVLAALVCLLGFVSSRAYRFAVPGGVLGGFGVGVLLASVTPANEIAGAVFFLAFAGGFVFVWLLGMLAEPADRHPWPLVAAAIIALVGLGAWTGTELPVQLLTIAGAGVLVLGGVALVAPPRNRRRAKPVVPRFGRPRGLSFERSGRHEEDPRRV